MAYLYIILAFITLFASTKGWSKLSSILMLVFVGLIGFSQLNNLDEPTYGFLISPIIYLLMNFTLANWNKAESLKWKFLFPTGLSVLFLIPIGIQINYNEYVIELSSFSSVFIILFGTLVIPIAKLKVQIISKPFDLLNTQQLENAVVILLAGIGIFISSLFASYFGVYLFAFGLLASTFYYNNTYQNTVVFILLFSALSFFFSMSGIDVLDLSLGKSAEGLLFGGALYLLTQSMISARKFKIAATGLTIFLIVLIMSGLMMIGTQKADFGGLDSFLIALLAISFGFTFEIKGQMGMVVVSLLLGLGLILAPLTVNLEENASTRSTLVPSASIKENKTELTTNLFDSKGISLDSIVGTYSINPETVQMNFELGPKGGRTKGAFKKILGEIEIKNNLMSSFVIDLPVSELTTFNKYRDESLMDVGYFNVKKFAKMTFKATKLIAVADGFEVLGSFSMLGISKELKVQIKYIGKSKSGYPILVGKSSLDRTQFGMKPDPKEGNVVDFDFSLELVQK